jgi:hypothetical protein
LRLGGVGLDLLLVPIRCRAGAALVDAVAGRDGGLLDNRWVLTVKGP